MNSDDNKVKVDWSYFKKSSSAQSEEISSYILLEVGYKYNTNGYNVSFLILRSPSLRTSPLFYTISPFHLYYPCVGQIVGIDSCPINTFLKSLVSSCKAKNYYLGITSSLMWPES